MSKNKMIYFGVFAYFLLGELSSNGQGIYYSQYMSSPLYINPAYTGQVNSEWRVSALSRIQGFDSKNTLSSFVFSYDRPITFENSQLGLGVIFNNSSLVGSNVPLNQLHISIGSGKKISQHSSLGLGLQLGIVHKQLSYSSLTFPNQYNRNEGSFNGSLNHNESFTSDNTNYFNLNVGLLWNYDNDKYNFSTGVCINSINRAAYTFLETENKVSHIINWHTTLKYALNEQLYVAPQLFTAIENSTFIYTLGSNLGCKIANETSKINTVSFGAYYRGDGESSYQSIIVNIGAHLKTCSAYFSYDFNISSNQIGIFTNAIEFSVSYQLPIAKLKYTTVPWIRY